MMTRFGVVVGSWCLMVLGVSSQSATEAVSVSVTIPVSIPLEVPAGTSFREAAFQFANRNGLREEDALQIEGALYNRWAEMQQQNNRRNQCANWQLQHAVRPLKEWGTLPADLRVQWLRMDCDSLVPEEPPKAVVTLDVQVGDTLLSLRAYDGDTVLDSVQRFAAAHGIDMAVNGQMLVDALSAKVRAQQAEQAEFEAREASFLFSIPISIDGTLQRLRVYQGDDLDTLVKSFCDKHNLVIANVGAQIRQVILDTTAALQKQLEDQAAATLAKQQERAQPQLLLDIPIDVDGKAFNMKLYDGDYVDTKIAEFCQELGLDYNVHGKQLMDHVQQRTQALSQ